MASRYGLEIRAAEAADAAGVVELLGACGLPAEPRAVAARLERLRAAGATVLLALEWGPPSGIVTLHVEPTLERDAPDARVSTLLVSPDARRRGIGRLLLKAASQAARAAGCAELRMAVADADAQTRGFCADSGFQPAARDLVRPLRKRAGTAAAPD